MDQPDYLSLVFPCRTHVGVVVVLTHGCVHTLHGPWLYLPFDFFFVPCKGDSGVLFCSGVPCRLSSLRRWYFRHLAVVAMCRLIVLVLFVFVFVFVVVVVLAVAIVVDVVVVLVLVLQESLQESLQSFMVDLD